MGFQVAWTILARPHALNKHVSYKICGKALDAGEGGLGVKWPLNCVYKSQ